jgi:hypothetical protein
MLDGLVEKVAEEYARFLRLDSEDAEAATKPFAARQAAAKSALAHLEALIKLADGGEDTAAHVETALQLGAARAALAEDTSPDDPSPDEGDDGSAG